jgi:hypothetical protein
MPEPNEEDVFAPNKEETALKQDILALLEETRAQVYRLFEKYSFDAAFFDMLIDFRVVVDEAELRVRERQKRVQ